MLGLVRSILTIIPFIGVYCILPIFILIGGILYVIFSIIKHGGILLAIPFFIIAYAVLPVFIIVGMILYGHFSVLKWIWT